MCDIKKFTEFIESCRDKKYNDINLISVSLVNVEKLLQNIFSFKKNVSYSDHNELLKYFFQIINIKTAELLVNHCYYDAIKIFDNTVTMVYPLFENDLISCLDYLVFQSKYILCLSYNRFILDSITKSKDILKLFEKKTGDEKLS